MEEYKRSLRNTLCSVNVWRRGDQRAPHKPLLLLLTLAAVQRGEARLKSYDETHTELEQLLRDFGPPRHSYHPEYPFWRLQRDGDFWDIPERDEAISVRGDRARTRDVPPSVLRGVAARGGFSERVHAVLREDQTLVSQIVGTILEQHFPPSMHEDILDAIGMPWVVEEARPPKRDLEFRRAIVRLYEHRCAMCGFDGRLGASDFALEAAHIKWHAMGGPDDPTNGLLLCSLHHKALDRGALGISPDREVIVSQHLHGGSLVSDLVLSLSGRQLRPPLDRSASPAERFMDWHRVQVFRGPPRPTG